MLHRNFDSYNRNLESKVVRYARSDSNVLLYLTLVDIVVAIDILLLILVPTLLILVRKPHQSAMGSIAKNSNQEEQFQHVVKNYE